LLFRLRI